MSKATFPGTCKNYVSPLASTPTEHGKTIIFIRKLQHAWNWNHETES